MGRKALCGSPISVVRSLALSLTLFTVAGCVSQFSCPTFEPTNVTPQVGAWDFDGHGDVDFCVYADNGVLTLDLDWDSAIERGQWGDYPTFGSLVIDNGAFRLQWGEIGGRHCPTDGFCFSGHFTSSRSAEGRLDSQYRCQVTSTTEWTAEWVGEAIATFVIPPTATLTKEESQETGNFEDDLPEQLVEACRAYVESESAGGEGDRLGYVKANAYLYLHPNDARALYLRAYGAAALVDHDSAAQDYRQALKIGLPRKQADLASSVLEAFDFLETSADFEAKIETLFKSLGAVRRDLKSICATSAGVPRQPTETSEWGGRFGYRDALSRLITPDSVAYTAAAELEYFPYEHSADVLEASNGVLNAALDLDQQGEHLLVSSLIKLNIRILTNFISARQQEGGSIESLNGVQILMNSLLDPDSPILLIRMGPPELRQRLQGFSGDEEGERVFLLVGRVIVENLDDPHAQELWNRLAPLERALLTGEETEYATWGFGECLAAAPRSVWSDEGARADSCVRGIVVLIKGGQVSVEDVELAILSGREEFPPTYSQAGTKQVFSWALSYFPGNLVSILEELAKDAQWKDDVAGVVDDLIGTIECQVLGNCMMGQEADLIEARNAAVALELMTEESSLKELVARSDQKLRMIWERLEESELTLSGWGEWSYLRDDIRSILERLGVLDKLYEF